MRILVVGATGDLGRVVTRALSARHEVIGASRHNATERLDLRSEGSVTTLLQRLGQLDAVVCTAGATPFAPFKSFGQEDFIDGLREKLFGQIALARLSLPHLATGGSITLTAGILNVRPIRSSSIAAVANGGLEGFIRAAALDLQRGIRINLVSPTVIEESSHRFGKYFTGFTSVSVDRVAQAFVDCVEGVATGQVFNLH